MNFLVFDIEAANGFKPYSICSFGYCLADENFNVLTKKNIWINPKCKYNLNGTRENVGINLHLDKDLLDSSPDFSEVYGTIKELLTNPDIVVVGHAVESDVTMLNRACQHYKLPCIEFNFICSQLLFRLFKGEKDVRALSKIADEIGLTYNAHTSDEDALASLYTLKYLTEKTGKSIEQLLTDYSIRIGSNKNFVITRTVSLTGQISKRNITKQSVEQITQYIKTSRLKPTGQRYKNKLFCLSRQIEISGQQVWQPIIDCIYQNGGKYTAKISKCNFYLYDTQEQKSQSDITREKYVDSIIMQGAPIKKLALNEFLD
jgi:DNA polymerase III epsilon subunit-like protein